MTLQSLVVLALHDVGKHFVVHLVRSAIRYSFEKRGKKKQIVRRRKKRKKKKPKTPQTSDRLSEAIV